MKTKDNELWLIELFRSEIGFNLPILFGNKLSCLKLFCSLVFPLWKRRWIDSSRKTDPPPDFYNKKAKLMMDVMRIDDIAYVDDNNRVQNETLKKEKELLRHYFGNDYKTVRDDITCIINVTSTLHDCSYERYIKNFIRVLDKHQNKIGQYQRNHPGYKTVFFVFDESLMYAEKLSKNDKESNLAGQIRVRPHICFYDDRFLSIIKNCKADYVVWFAAHKALPVLHDRFKVYNRCAIFDVIHIKSTGTTYDPTKIIPT